MEQDTQEARFPIFKERLNALLAGRSITFFANRLGISRQTMGFYLSGERIPDIKTLRQICESCGVSSDWLIGLSDVRSTDASVKRLCEYTGLSEETVNSFRETMLVEGNQKLQGINQFFGWSSGVVREFNQNIYEAINAPDERDADDLIEDFLEALDEKRQETGIGLLDYLRDLGAEIVYPNERAGYWKARAMDTVSICIEKIRQEQLGREELAEDQPQRIRIKGRTKHGQHPKKDY